MVRGDFERAGKVCRSRVLGEWSVQSLETMPWC